MLCAKKPPQLLFVDQYIVLRIFCCFVEKGAGFLGLLRHNIEMLVLCKVLVPKTCECPRPPLCLLDLMQALVEVGWVEPSLFWS